MEAALLRFAGGKRVRILPGHVVLLASGRFRAFLSGAGLSARTTRALSLEPPVVRR